MSIDYEKCIPLGDQERLAMDAFLDKFLPETNQFYYARHFTKSDSTAGYDCLIERFDKQTGNLIKRIFCEVKTRAKHFPSLLLEKEKLDFLLSLIKEKPSAAEVSKIYYVNFTPKCTVVFDLLKLINKNLMNFVHHPHNFRTIDTSLGKIMKEVAYLDVSHGKSFDFVFQANK